MEALLHRFAPSNSAISFHHRLNLCLNHRTATSNPTQEPPPPPKPQRFKFSFSSYGAVRCEGLLVEESRPPDLPVIQEVPMSAEWLTTMSRRAFAICSRPVKINAGVVSQRSLKRLPAGLVRHGIISDSSYHLPHLQSQQASPTPELSSSAVVWTDIPTGRRQKYNHQLNPVKTPSPVVWYRTNIGNLHTAAKPPPWNIRFSPYNLRIQSSVSSRQPGPSAWNRTGIGTFRRRSRCMATSTPLSENLTRAHLLQQSKRRIPGSFQLYLLLWGIHNLMSLAHLLVFLSKYWSFLHPMEIGPNINHYTWKCSFPPLSIIFSSMRIPLALCRLTGWVDDPLTLQLEWLEDREIHIDNDCVHRFKLKCPRAASSLRDTQPITYHTPSRVSLDIYKPHRAIGKSGNDIHVFLFRLDLALTRSSPTKMFHSGFPSSLTCASLRMFRVLECIGILALGHAYHRRILICYHFSLLSCLIRICIWWEFMLMKILTRTVSTAVSSPSTTILASLLAYACRADNLLLDVITVVPLVSLKVALSFVTSIASLPFMGCNWSLPNLVCTCLLFFVCAVFTSIRSLLLGMFGSFPNISPLRLSTSYDL